MIPTKTLRERMRDAIEAKLDWLEDESKVGLDQWPEHLAAAAVEAIGDPCLIKTADSLEPIYPLRAQDLCAAATIDAWINEAFDHGVPAEKIELALEHARAFRDWPTRKWPD